MRETGALEDIERLGEHDLGSDARPRRSRGSRRMALEKRPLVDDSTPIGDADGEVAERLRRDLDPRARRRSRCIAAKADSPQ